MSRCDIYITYYTLIIRKKQEPMSYTIVRLAFDIKPRTNSRHKTKTRREKTRRVLFIIIELFVLSRDHLTGIRKCEYHIAEGVPLGELMRLSRIVDVREIFVVECDGAHLIVA